MAYPVTLTNFIQRALAKVSTEEDKELMREAIKDIIAKTISNNKLWTCNWNARKIPTVLELRSKTSSPLTKRPLPYPSLPHDGEEFLTESHKAKRMKRFTEEDSSSRYSPVAVKTKFQRRKEILQNLKPTNTNSKQVVIVGTSTILEKSFYRQTGEPDPSLIRPEWVLRKSLKLIKTKWKK